MAKQALPTAAEAGPRAAQPENGRWKGYQQLLLARMKELWREPEVIFWVFVFPILLALGLGIAFRASPTEVRRVAIAAGPEAAARVIELLQASAASDSIRAEVLPPEEALDRFRLGKC